MRWPKQGIRLGVVGAMRKVEEIWSLVSGGKLWRWVLCALATVVVYLASCVPGRPSYSSGDLLDYEIPTQSFIAKVYWAGSLPVWRDHTGLGSSIQLATLYPPIILSSFLPLAWALAFLVLSHMIAMALGTYAWLKALGLKSFPSMVGAILLCSVLVTDTWWPPIFYTMSWLPWLLWSMEREDRLGRWAWRCVFLTLQLLAGFPQLFLYSLLFCFLYRYGLKKAWAPKQILADALMLVLVVLITAPSFLPAWHQKSHSLRQNTLDPYQVHYIYSAELPYRSIRQDLRSSFEFTKRFFSSEPKPVISSLSTRHHFGYLGSLPPILLLAFLIFCKPSARHLFFLSVMALGFYLSLGFVASIPLYSWMTETLPLFGSFRTPDRFLIWFLMAMVYICATGLSALRWDPWRLFVWAGISMAPVAYRMLVHQQYIDGSMIFVFLSLWVLSKRHMDIGRIWIPALALMFMLVEVSLTTPYIQKYLEHPKGVFEGIWSSSKPLLSAKEVEKLHEKLGHQRVFIEGHSLAYKNPNHPMIRDITYYEALIPEQEARLHLKLSEDNPHKNIRYMYHKMSLEDHLRFLDTSAVEYIVTQRLLDNPEKHGFELITGFFEKANLYRNVWSLPRARLSNSMIWDAPAESSTISDLALPSNQGYDLVGIQPLGLATLGIWPLSAPKAESRANLTWHKDFNGVRIFDVEMASAHWLVLADAWAPGWSCTVDAQPRPVYKADGLTMAVELQSGDRSVEMRYTPQGLKVGGYLSLLGFFIFIAILTTPTLRDRLFPVSTVE